MFPLPCEDNFAEARTVSELANQFLHLREDKDSTAAGTCFKTTSKQCSWSKMRQRGVKQSAVLLPRSNDLHVALKFRAGPSGPCVGQCVVALRSDVYHKVDFATAVTLGGQHVGMLTGKLHMHVTDAQSS